MAVVDLYDRTHVWTGTFGTDYCFGQVFRATSDLWIDQVGVNPDGTGTLQWQIRRSTHTLGTTPPGSTWTEILASGSFAATANVSTFADITPIEVANLDWIWVVGLFGPTSGVTANQQGSGAGFDATLVDHRGVAYVGGTSFALPTGFLTWADGGYGVMNARMTDVDPGGGGPSASRRLVGVT
jgi:hypothetical protein